MEAIVTERLSKQYGSTWAVKDLDLEVRHGEIFGFLGPNGAGKTTTIRILTTLTKPTYGGAWVEGYDVLRESDKVRKVIGVVQQHLSLDRDLTVRENMMLRARLHKIPPLEREQRIKELLDYTGLTEHADKPVNALSGGLQRRAMIACSLSHKPRILFLDEPTVGLDAHTRRRMWELIRRLNTDGVTTFLTTHYIEEAEALCHRVGIIHHGRLIALGEPQELRRKVGMLTVVTAMKDGSSFYRYFPSRDSATQYIKSLPPSVRVIVVRESNLEDIFIELTGRRIEDN